MNFNLLWKNNATVYKITFENRVTHAPSRHDKVSTSISGTAWILHLNSLSSCKL